MNGMLNVKSINNFDHTPLLSSVDEWPFPFHDFLNKMYILSTFSNISLPFPGVHFIEGRPWATLLKHEQLFDVKQNLFALKNTFSLSSFFPLPT